VAYQAVEAITTMSQMSGEKIETLMCAAVSPTGLQPGLEACIVYGRSGSKELQKKKWSEK
jgi:hypothetical protein